MNIPLLVAIDQMKGNTHSTEAKHYNSPEEINLLSPKEMMFLDELSPLFQELIQKPLAFTGGFVSGVLKLDPSSDPVMNWFSKATGIEIPNPMKNSSDDDSDSGPQTIDIE